MTTRNRFPDRNRDQQDGTERHVHDEMTYPPEYVGAHIKVRGNGTEDELVPVLRIGGAWLHLPKGYNADVFLVAGGSDTNQKHALTDIPRDKQRKTKEGTSGIQHPTNPDIALEISDKGVRVTVAKFAVGPTGVLEVKDGNVYVRGDLHIKGKVRPEASGTPDVPPFEA